MSLSAWVVDLWYRLPFHHHPPPAPPPPVDLPRDPDLDLVHIQQHDLMNRVSAEQIRRSMEERQARLRILEKQANPRGIGRDE